MEVRVKLENTDINLFVHAATGTADIHGTGGCTHQGVKDLLEDESGRTVKTDEALCPVNVTQHEVWKHESEDEHFCTSNDVSPAPKSGWLSPSIRCADAQQIEDHLCAQMYVKSEPETGVMRMVFDPEIVANIKKEPQATEFPQCKSGLHCKSVPSSFKQQLNTECTDHIHTNGIGKYKFIKPFTKEIMHPARISSTLTSTKTGFIEQEIMKGCSDLQKTESMLSVNSDLTGEETVYPTCLFLNNYMSHTEHSETILEATSKKQKEKNSTIIQNSKHCSSTFTRIGSLKVHMRKHNRERPFLCSQCSATFSSSASLYQHKRTHRDDKSHKCSDCSASFPTASYLRVHMKIHSDQTHYRCSECSAAFTQSSNLKVHMKKNTGDISYKCPECPVAFDVENKLKDHMRIHTGDRPLQCSECSAFFSQACNLKVHTRTHTGEKYQCLECSAVFAQKSSLKRHLKIHSRDKSFLCSICPAAFIRAEPLKIHMRTHTGEKPFQCTECDSSFAHRSTLKSHIRTHTGEKPYTCTECPMSFSQPSPLKSHMKIHIGADDKPAKCAECPAAFNHLRSLNMHVKKCHSKGKLS